MHNSPWPTTRFYLSFLLPLLVVLCIYEGGWWSVAPLALIFVFLPLGDALLGVADQWREAPDLAFNKYFRLVTWLWVPVQLALLYWVIREVAGGRLTPLESAGAAVSMGAVAGIIGATMAHELLHRRHGVERALAHLLLLGISYQHAAIAHIPGHHRWVGTRHDPGTARLNETFYAFLLRAVTGTVRSAWAIEKQRLLRNNQRRLSSANRMLREGGMLALLYAGLAYWGGTGTALAFAGQSAIAIVIVEAVNYIEHYGLERRELVGGEYEKVAPYHSWDSAYRVSNWLLINLPRHADHHCSASKRYQALELLPQAPRLPGGYGKMLLAALVPPLWFSIMNPRVAAAARLARP